MLPVKLRASTDTTIPRASWERSSTEPPPTAVSSPGLTASSSLPPPLWTRLSRRSRTLSPSPWPPLPQWLLAPGPASLPTSPPGTLTGAVATATGVSSSGVVPPLWLAPLPPWCPPPGSSPSPLSSPLPLHPPLPSPSPWPLSPWTLPGSRATLPRTSTSRRAATPSSMARSKSKESELSQVFIMLLNAYYEKQQRRLIECVYNWILKIC